MLERNRCEIPERLPLARSVSQSAKPGEALLEKRPSAGNVAENETVGSDPITHRRCGFVIPGLECQAESLLIGALRLLMISGVDARPAEHAKRTSAQQWIGIAGALEESL